MKTLINKLHNNINQIIFILIFTLFSSSFYASHIPGGNITYENVGPNTFVLTLTLYEDCGSSFMSSNNLSIIPNNNCGLNYPSISLPNIIFQQEISQLCFSNIGQSECNGGNLPGIYMHVWQDTIVLPGLCNSWTFSYSLCCRNTSINLSGQPTFYLETVLNSQTAPTNSSPVVTAQPIPYYCVNHAVVYNFGIYEPDGNTLVFSLVNAMSGAGTNANYVAPYTGAVPINGININSATGEITFLPTIIGNFVVAVLIEEFDAAGNLVGSITQDFQFEIINTTGCSNANPAAPVNGISNLVSTAVQTGPVDIQACEGDNVCFDVVFTDADPLDSVYLSSNITQLFPGGTFTQNTFFSPASATICFTVLPGSNPFSLLNIDARDNSCPIVGINSMGVGITVVSSTYAGQDVTMCLGVGTQLQASGGSNFTWSVISGDPIVIGTNFSCNNCANPIANPAITTTYEVISNLAGGCTNIDTVELTVVPDFSYTVMSSTSASCLMQDIGFSTVVNPNVAGYTYDWSPGTDLNSTSIPNPIFSPQIPGVYSYYVEITSPDGCVHNDSVNITISAGVKPNITAFTTDSMPFCGTQVTLWGEVDTTLVSAGISDDFDPAINMSMWSSLLEASTGNSCGVNSGTNALHFAGTSGTRYAETVAFNTAPCATIDFCLFLGNSLSGGSPCENCDTGDDVELQYSINGGATWVLIQLFDHSWWDNGGVHSNSWACFSIVIPPGAISNSTQFRWYQTPTAGGTGTGFDNWSLDDVQITCSTLGNYVYQWTPPTGIISVNNDTTLLDVPMANGPHYYSIIVTDTSGNCSDTATVLINVLCDTCMAPIPTLTHITCFGGSDGSILAQPTGVDGPPWIVELLDPLTNVVLQNDNNVVTTTTFAGLSAGSYIVRSIDTAGCYADTLINLTQPLAVTVSVSSDTVICIGGVATLTATGSGGVSPFTYTWTGLPGNTSTQIVNPTISNYYNVVATDDNGCNSIMDSILVALNPPIMINAFTTDTVCPGGTASISITPIGGYVLPGSSYTYVWTDASGNQVGNTALVDVIPTSSPSTYYVVVSDDCSTPAVLDSIEVIWYQEPQVDFISLDNTGCHPVTASFTNTTPSNQTASCLWSFGDGNFSITCGTVSNIYTSPGIYSVTLEVTSPEGCVSDTTISNIVEVYAYPTAMFSATPNPTTVLNPTVNFIDSSSQDVISSSWQFTDAGSSVLGNSSQTNPSFTFPETQPGTYIATLTVINANGCEDIHNLQVIVNGVFTCYVPNAFTPDADGLNDFFFVQGESIDANVFNLSVFNKWGEKIFETDEYVGTKSGMWDGTYKNEPAQQDIYIWKIDTKDTITGEHKELTGHVLLMR